MKTFKRPHRRLRPVVLFLLWTLETLASSAVADGYNDSSSLPFVFLTNSNYDSLTANKTLFIKWAAPWCGHSQDLARAWNRLVKTVAAGTSKGEGDDSLLIAEVDCSSQSEWCVKMGYTAYPTLTYGDGSMGGVFLETYTSVKKDYEDLLKFYNNELLHKSFCTPGNLMACGDIEEQDRIRRFSQLQIEDLERMVAEEEGRIGDIDNEFERRNQELQKEYDQILKEHESETATIKQQLKLFKKLLRETSSRGDF